VATVERALVSDQVFRILCEGVLTGRYAAGELLPTQRALAADLGVNMASIREAVKRLEQLGLVESRQGEGMRVRDWRRHGGLDVLAHLIFTSGGLDQSTFAAVLEARRLMLGEAARLAAGRRSAEQAKRLERVAAAIADADDPEQVQALDFAFFSELVEAADNVVFVLITNSIRELYFRHADFFRPLLADHGKLAPYYRRAARAVAAGDVARAAGAVRRLAETQEAQLMGSLK
jgi:GntR family transcriptional regulator, transcriptional repressor for pyruvate dehydrogenase complex